MTRRTVDLNAQGLLTDPSPHSKVPAGALRQADDIVIRRPGIIEPRPQFDDPIGWSTPTGTLRFAVPFDDDALLFSLNGSTWTVKWLSDGATVTGFSGPAVGKYIGSATARQSAYICTDDGVYKLEGADDDVMAEAGLPRGMQGQTSLLSTGETWLTAGSTVAYRVCYRRTDGNDYDVVSAPSGRMVIKNTDGAARAISFKLPIPATVGLVAGDTIEIYRTLEVTTNTPSDELYLAVEYQLTATDISNTYAEPEDHTGQDSLGRRLYTNESEDGPTRENGRPPLAYEVEEYQGSMFYGRTVSRHRRVLELNSDVGWRWFGTTDAITADFANTDATVTNIAGITMGNARAGEVTAGQYILEDTDKPGVAGTYIPADTKVSSVAGSTSIEMTNAATDTAAGVAINFADVIDIDGDEYVAWSATDETNTPPVFRADTAEVSPISVRTMAQELCYVINYQGNHVASVLGAERNVDGGNTDERVTILVEEHDLRTAATSIPVTITNGYAWSPGGAAQVTTDLTADDKPNRLMWSKTNLPEAVPVEYFADLGSEDAAVLRMVRVRDALFVFKEDGVWRVSGAGALGGFRADLLSRNTRLLARKAVDVLDDQLVAWTNHGVVAFSDQSYAELSDPAIGSDLNTIESAILDAGGCEGAWITAKPTDNEAYVGVPASASDEYASNIYVFNTKTKAWVKWTLPAWYGIRNPADDELHLCSRPDSTSYELLRGDGTDEGYTSVIEWTTRSEADPVVIKRWSRGYAVFDTAKGIASVDADFESDLSTTAVSFTPWDPVASDGVLDEIKHMPFWVPRAHAMSTHLFCKLTINHMNYLAEPYASPAWRLVGLSLEYSPASVRPRRSL